ncbi:MAG: type IX secretion system membrane protein PorP/SprF [Prolixibacteraceae bacterium]|nr:type IX secretion system membrane protein PorP/SprF [Prolixibacteraceae bacterium]
MKKILAAIILCFLAFNINAQQTAQYNYHIFDDYLLNPSYVGTQNYYSVLVGRDQRFYGLTNSSPQTYFLSVHSRVGEGYVFKKDGKINEFFRKFGNVAFGLQFYQYMYGPERETNIGFTYGYHLDLKPNFKRKNPRKLILSLTPRLQGMWVSAKDLHLISNSIGDDDPNKIFYDPALGEYTSYRSWMFTADVAALFQTIHMDAGLGAMNLVQTKNKLESLYYYKPNDSIAYSIYDTLYPMKIYANAKLKFLDIYSSDQLDVYFIPSVAALYYTKRNCMEFFADLMLESTFKKTIAGVRKEIQFVGQLGLNINHRREYTPVTLLQPYFALDFKNYTITYAHSFYLENDLVHSGAAIGGNQITFLFKINRDRVVREQQYQQKFLSW